jgi:hypothetical protein
MVSHRTPAPAEVPMSGQEPREQTQRAPARRKLDTPTNRPKVIRALADGKTNRALADEYGCVPSAVSSFRARHGRSIAKLREELADAAAAEDGLWIASRLDRLGVLQDAVERLLEVADTADASALPELIRTKISALHEAAEQLGQLPSRMSAVSTTVVNYRFDGVDLEAL